MSVRRISLIRRLFGCAFVFLWLLMLELGMLPILLLAPPLGLQVEHSTMVNQSTPRSFARGPTVVILL